MIRLFQNQALTYIFVGLCVALFQYASFTVAYAYMHTTSFVASASSFVLTVLVSYVLQRYVTFREHEGERKRSLRVSLVLFTLNAFLGLGINSLVFYSCTEVFMLTPYSAQGVSMAVLATYNFFIYRLILT